MSLYSLHRPLSTPSGISRYGYRSNAQETTQGYRVTRSVIPVSHTNRRVLECMNQPSMGICRNSNTPRMSMESDQALIRCLPRTVPCLIGSTRHRHKRRYTARPCTLQSRVLLCIPDPRLRPHLYIFRGIHWLIFFSSTRYRAIARLFYTMYSTTHNHGNGSERDPLRPSLVYGVRRCMYLFPYRRKLERYVPDDGLVFCQRTLPPH